MFGAYLTTLLPTLFGLAYKIQALDPNDKEMHLGLVVGIGALVNILVTLMTGALTDRTRCRWGRRRPWIAAGIALCALSGVGLALAPNQWLLGAVWVLYVIGNAGILSGLTPVMADQIAKSQRAKVGGLSGVAAALAGVSASLLGDALTHNLVLMFLLPVMVLAACFPVYVVTIPDRPAMRAARHESVTRIFRQLVFNPRHHHPCSSSLTATRTARSGKRTVHCWSPAAPVDCRDLSRRRRRS